MPSPGAINLRESWNRISADYQREYPIRTDSAHYGVSAPHEDELQLLGDVAGLRLLEAGCGGGQCSIAFARQGAVCTGVDQSDAQIAFARSLAEREGVPVEFYRGDMAPFLEAQPAASFDGVFSAYALSYVDDLPRVFAAVHKLLKPGAWFVFSLDHPISNVTGFEDGVVRFAESYFARGRADWEWGFHGGPAQPFCSFHRTTGDLVNLVIEAGLVIEKLLEPEPPAAGDSWCSPEDRERYRIVPATLILKARKPAV